ncbi:ribosomal protein L13 [Metarhizium rileyi]|uniref:Large ribosomal subunit protein uL13m n=1 Tax=Metarhizium rileyi (strain RCEF 4871) TaxID=1649241 RepID=A0A162JEH1_METRR|nr:ribosomal protein L13 [Metarhizium rileyi RCEF 4871]
MLTAAPGSDPWVQMKYCHDTPDPRRIASLPVACIASTMADGAAELRGQLITRQWYRKYGLFVPHVSSVFKRLTQVGVGGFRQTEVTKAEAVQHHEADETTLQTRLAYSRVWHQISASTPHKTLTTQPDVTPPSLGRLASRIAVLLMGKHKPIWDPSTDCGDYVVVTNCAALHTTGRKMWRKSYYRHTTRPGSLKELTMDALMEKHGGSEVLRKAVRGMLPKNRLRDKRLARLKAFEGGAHPYKDNLKLCGWKVIRTSVARTLHESIGKLELDVAALFSCGN